jgi:SAM-dependent methyltransferase
MTRIDAQNLVSRYKQNYGIPADAEVTESMIQRHWELEQRLTRELLESNADNRREVFARCYDALYRELEWLNRLTETSDASSLAEWHGVWKDIIGEPPQKIFEVGSGRGELISFLAAAGYDCTATEITRERGERFAPRAGRVTWKSTDGVHLERFEEPYAYDVVLSNSLIEHLHPDDILDHCKGALSILRNGGRYVFCTPHRASGPSDVSIVFGCDEPRGMHLKEYTYRELIDVLSRAGFQRMDAVLIPAKKMGRLLGRASAPFASHADLSFFCILERFILLLPNRGIQFLDFAGIFIYTLT